MSDEREISKEERDASRQWFEKSIKGCSPEQWQAALAPRKARNRRLYGEMGKWVNGNVGGELLNPEYLARADNTKKLREQLKRYAGSPEAASDILFSTKKEADAKGQDFSMAALDKIDELIGKTEEPDPIFIPVQPKKSLAGRLAHKLWKMGFPMGKFFKNKLEVEEADK